jgi:hypothetical protein
MLGLERKAVYIQWQPRQDQRAGSSPRSRTFEAWHTFRSLQNERRHSGACGRQARAVVVLSVIGEWALVGAAYGSQTVQEPVRS